MNRKQFEIWEKQKRREYRTELEKLQNDLAERGLALSSTRIKAEEDLKEKYDSEIEIMRLGLDEDINIGHVAVKMTESARNNVFINSQIHGRVEIAGQGNSFIETKINTLKEKHPFWFWFTAIGTLIGIITGLMFLAQYFNFLPPTWYELTQLTSPNQNFVKISVDGLRGLESLETGKPMNELPDGVYFFQIPAAIVSQLDDMSYPFLLVRNKRLGNYSFEIQKYDKRYYLVGFVSDEVYAQLGSVSSQKPLYEVLYPVNWGGASHPIAIPFDQIVTIRERDIDLDASTEMSVLDISFKEVKTYAIAHGF